MTTSFPLNKYHLFLKQLEVHLFLCFVFALTHAVALACSQVWNWVNGKARPTANMCTESVLWKWSREAHRGGGRWCHVVGLGRFITHGFYISQLLFSWEHESRLDWVSNEAHLQITTDHQPNFDSYSVRLKMCSYLTSPLATKLPHWNKLFPQSSWALSMQHLT